MRFECSERLRLRVVKRAGKLNGVDYLELAAAGPVQRTLLVRLLLKPAAPIKVPDITIGGGERIASVAVQWVATADALPSGEDPALVAGLDKPEQVLVVRTVEAGDFSYYTLRIGADGFDPMLNRVEFTFKVDCAGGFDCKADCRCAQPSQTSPKVPELDYLAKDYQSLRRMLLDRLSLVTPRWRERNAADLGVMLVELLAYAGDRLSYRQDAHTTDAYFGTARSRIALRRHARLVDYRMHDGCSARVLLRFKVPAGAAVRLPAGTRVWTKADGLPRVLGPEGFQAAAQAGAVAFETADAAVLYADHDEMPFYTWGERGCCLRAGSTSATLAGEHPRLKAGDILILASPERAWRHAVRLVQVSSSQDPSGGHFKPVEDDDPVPVTEIVWDQADALPFDLRIDSGAAADPVAVAWGNIVVADHGMLARDDNLGAVQTRRFRPRLRYGPLTHSVPVNPVVVATADGDSAVQHDLDLGKSSQLVRSWLGKHGVRLPSGSFAVRGGDGEWSVSDGATVARITLLDNGRLRLTGRPMAAARVTDAAPSSARPAISLTATPPGGAAVAWQPRWDLLGSGPAATEFAVETEHDGTVYLRFGDGEQEHGHGRRPEPGTEFTARYRVGNGLAGNVGAEAVFHLERGCPAEEVVNPLPAAGGREAETADEVRRDAPEAYLVQERAVTPADWAEVATRDPRIQRAAATWRWTGSWHTVFLTVDRLGGAGVDEGFEAEQRARLERYRLAGYDLELDAPRYVPIELELRVCVGAAHLRSQVRRDVLSAVAALFDADQLTFAQPVYLSPVYAAVRAVAGVESVDVTVFRRQHEVVVSGLESGVLAMGRLEIARLDNNPDFPERGVVRLTCGGGR